MRILKRLSLQAALVSRLTAPKPSSEWVKRSVQDHKIKEHKMMTEQQLSRFGYQSKQGMGPSKIILAVLSTGLGLLLYVYTEQLYKNQKNARNKYRIMEMEHPSLKLRFRYIFVRMSAYLDKNLFPLEIKNKNNKKVDKMSESTLRILQYQNFMEKRDKRFDFMELGVMEKFPYPQQ